MGKKGAVQFLSQSLFLLALTFLGWGLGDLRGFFADPARLAFVLVSLASNAALMFFARDVVAFRKGERAVSGQRWYLSLTAVLQGALSFFLPYGDRRGILVFEETAPIRFFGLALAIAGAAVRVVAIRRLDKQFSVYITLQKDHQLVQTGIYGVIRHPIYFGFLVMMPGIALIFRSWLFAPAFLLAASFAALRIRQEEKLLREQFGDEFAAYAGRTWRLIPYVY